MTKEKEKNFRNYIQYSGGNPVESFVPGQSYKMSDLIQRFERNQRLGVHLNFNPNEEYSGNHETLDVAPPEDVHDIVDVQAYYNEHLETKRAYSEKNKKEGKDKDEPQGKDADEPKPNLPSE